MEDCSLYSGKHRPYLYLKSEIRNGISSFTDIAYKDEIDKGLFKLSGDIKGGFINSIIRKYENNRGDYVFIVAKKAISQALPDRDFISSDYTNLI